MRTETQEKLLKILFKALKPLVHMLLESGIGHREFSQIAKMAFVDVATKNYGIRGRDTNISRVAVMTGLTRKEVKRVRDGLGETADSVELRPIPASIVIHSWSTDPAYLDSHNKPRVLHFDKGPNSFQDMVRKYAGDIPPGAIRTELKRTGAIKIDPDGRLRLLRREFLPAKGNDLMLRALARPLTGLLLNLEHNNVLHDERKKKAFAWPEAITMINVARPKDMDQVHNLVVEKIKRFNIELDDELAKFAQFGAANLDQNHPTTSVAVGAYYFES